MKIPENLTKEQLISDLMELRRRILQMEQTEEERKRFQEELFRTKAMFEGLFEFAPDAIVVVDREGRITAANKQAERMFGYSRAELLGAFHDILLPERFRDKHMADRGGYISAPHIRPMGTGMELYGRKKDGREFPVDIALGPLQTEKDIVVLAVVRDITERKQHEEALRQSEERLRESEARFASFMFNLPAAAWIKDLHGRYVYVNSETERIFSISLPELLGKTDEELFPRETAQQFVENDRRVLAEGGVLRTTEVLRQADATDHHSLVSKFAVPGPDGQPAYIGGIAFDITDLKQMEQALRESESMFRAMASTAMEAVILLDNDGNVSFWNDAATKIFGYTKDEMMGKYLHSFIMPERHVDIFRKGFEKFRMTGKGRFIGTVYEIEAKKKDGTEFPVELSLAALTLKDKWNALGIVRDITERKRAEESLIKAMAELARSNSDLEQFAYVVSHDLQAPVRSIGSFAEVIAQDYRGKLDADADKYLDLISKGAKRIQRMIKDILAYSRIGTGAGELTTLNCEAVLSQAIENLHTSIDESGAVITHGPLPSVKADQSQMIMLFQNLIGNAIKFSSERPRVHVDAARKDIEWVFSVQDNGIGIDPEEAERIFSPFQRLHTEKEYPGTGVGLAVCKKIVERHGGRIWVESTPGKGSQFFFTIPHSL